MFMSILIADKNFLNSNPGALDTSIETYPDGIVIPVDKPYRWTSADVIRKIKFTACRHFGKKNLKVGHAGTLDPLATGILIVCIGKATKLAETYQRHDKEYIAGISFGATTPSYDLEKDIDRTYPYGHITEDAVKEAAKTFLGEQEQIAPLFSAKSVDGVRAYELARQIYRKSKNSGEHLDFQADNLLSRQMINISEIEVLDFSPDGRAKQKMQQSASEENARNARINVADNSALYLPYAEIRIACTKGTYIRAFARDLGEALNSGAHLSSLRRTKSGSFDIASSLSVEQTLSILRS